MSSETKTAHRYRRASLAAAVVAIYTAAIFLSAALLFAVQPMFTKIVLPRFGGSPSVWAVAMVFFQGILLFGYAYADALTRFAGRRLALPIHLGVMMGGAMFLPLAIAEGWGMPTPGREETVPARPVRRLDRISVLCAVGERSAAAGVVRAKRPS